MFSPGKHDLTGALAHGMVPAVPHLPLPLLDRLLALADYHVVSSVTSGQGTELHSPQFLRSEVLDSNSSAEVVILPGWGGSCI